MKMRLLVPAIVFAGFWALLLATSGRVSTTQAGPQDEAITFSNQVVRIFQNQCQTCHHTGGVAPFSLETYDSAATWAESIRTKTSTRQMPPWQARPDCGNGFVNERRLTDAEIATIAQWVEAGAPEGDRAQLPPLLEWPEDWELGEPDVVLLNDAKGYDVPSYDDGKYDRFRCFSIPTNFAVDRYVTGFEILRTPGVQHHHALIYLDVDGQSVPLDRAQAGPGYDNVAGPGFDAPLIGGWNPGARPVSLPEGAAVRIPAGARIVLQVHYASTDAVQHDQTKLGLHLARTPVRKSRFTIIPKNETFLIPAGDPHYRVDAEITIDEPLTVLSAAPHMHFIGKDMQVEAILPSGETRCLIGVDWDIHWQGTYTYRQAIQLPAGTRIHATSYYDNSADNPNNPNVPPIDVPWFPTENTEMMFCTLGVTADNEQLPVSSPAVASVKVSGSKLVLSATNVHPGAFILVNGKILADTKIKGGGAKIVSSKAWKRLVAPGAPVSVSVLNPDGVSAPAVTFTR